MSPRARRTHRPAGGSALLTFHLILFLVPAAGCKHGGGDGGDPLQPPGDQPAFPFANHISQAEIASGFFSFQSLFDQGDALFEARYNSLDGVGALLLPDGTPLPSRFSRVPPGGGRLTGPNGQACEGCHNVPFGTGAGEAASNVLQDPGGTGIPPFNFRNTTSLFGAAALQRLAEEMTEDLLAARDRAAAQAIAGGPAIVTALESKGISYGSLSVQRDAGGALTFDAAGVEGVDADLVVRPYGWKGNVVTLRDFCRGAARNELGMEPDELVAKDPVVVSDPDGDGVEGELTVGDVTVLTLYVGAQEIPTTVDSMVRAGLLPPSTSESANLASRGRTLFQAIGCAGCHVPELRLADVMFEEPTRRGGGNYLDGDLDPAATFLDPDRRSRFNLIQEGQFPRLAPHPAGGARVPLFGDLKRHNMGIRLADAQPTPSHGADGRALSVGGMPVVIPTQVFLTAELWGAGSTGPWLHDGRAASLEQAIELHGADAPPAPGDPSRSEAQEERDAFQALSAADRLAVVEFLRSLILFSLPEGEEEEE